MTLGLAISFNGKQEMLLSTSKSDLAATVGDSRRGEPPRTWCLLYHLLTGSALVLFSFVVVLGFLFAAAEYRVGSSPYIELEGNSVKKNDFVCRRYQRGLPGTDL